MFLRAKLAQHVRCVALEQASPTAPPPLYRQQAQKYEKQGEGLSQLEPRLFEHLVARCTAKKLGQTGHRGASGVVDGKKSATGALRYVP